MEGLACNCRGWLGRCRMVSLASLQLITNHQKRSAASGRRCTNYVMQKSQGVESGEKHPRTSSGVSARLGRICARVCSAYAITTKQKVMPPDLAATRIREGESDEMDESSNGLPA